MVSSLAVLWVLASPMPLEAVFARYAPCARLDARVLDVLAAKESDRRPDFVNAAGYTGLFQTKPANCRRALAGLRLAEHCEHLTDPEVNTAVAVTMAAQTRVLVDRACPQAPLRLQLALLYAGHNLGHAALAEALTHGCTEAHVREGAVAHYRGKGARIAKAYAPKFKPECLAAGGDDASCTAGPKLDYAFLFADAVLAAGVTQWSVEPDAGACPIR